MSNDGCKRSGDDASRLKEASGIIVFLQEELGDARLRCAQLKKYVKEATDIIEKSTHRDHFFEVAGNLIYGIPDTLLKLDKALDATALAAARLDYEEIKNGLRPNKTDELEQALEDTRLRYLNRRSNEESMNAKVAHGYIAFYKGKQIEVEANSSYEAQRKAAELFKAKKPHEVTVVLAEKDGHPVVHKPLFANQETPMNAKTAAYFLNKIADLMDKQGRVPVAAVMTLVAQLEKGDKRASALNAKAATAFRNIAKTITEQKNPSRIALAGLLRRIVGDTLQIGVQQQGQQAGQQQGQQAGQQQGQQAAGYQQQQQAGAGEDFQKANPKITDEEAKVIDEMHAKHKDVVKDKAEQEQQQQ